MYEAFCISLYRGLFRNQHKLNCVPSVSLPPPSSSMDSQLIFMLLASWFAFASVLQRVSAIITLDSALHPTVTPTSWISPSDHFAFGFYPQGSGYSVGAWLVTPGNTTVIWTAFRDNTPFPKSVSLKLTNQGLKLLNTTTGDQFVSNDNFTAVSASMLDSGNFVIHGPNSETLWQTFDYPTDTIMPGQKLTKGAALFSSISATNPSKGKAELDMQDDGNLVLYPVDGYSSIDAYWDINTNPIGYTNVSLNLDADGSLYVLRDNETVKFRVGSQNSSTLETYLARLDSDGIFRLYSYNFAEQEAPAVLAKFPNLTDLCLVKVACGFNSFCTSNNGQVVCLCLPGFDYADPQDKSNGCTKNSTSACPSSPGKDVVMIPLQNMVWLGDPYVVPASINSMTGCIDACKNDCFCDVVLFDSGKCMKQKFPMKYGRQATGILTTAYIKIVSGDRLAQEPASFVRLARDLGSVASTKVVIVSVVVLTFLVIIIVALCLLGRRYWHTIRKKSSTVEEILTIPTRDTIMEKSSTVEEILAFPRWFTYEELSDATGGFNETLGKGSFGTVFRGALTLAGGKQIAVAVKRLERMMMEEGELEFRAEMMSSGRTHHKNLVRLLGFCEEGTNRLLVYELMNKGSLADIIFSPVVAERPPWSQRVRIVLEVARGINYLHEDCDTCIIHCDIKPQNVLMDDNCVAKISDFGLAKLLMPSQARTFTEMRGTRGYLAPEWVKNAPISVKADVYSFGIMLLETLCCRRHRELKAQPDEIFLVDWVYNCYMGRELNKLVSVEEDIDEEELGRMVKVGLWCIQNEPSLRPDMKKVLMMLEGNTQVPTPPLSTSVS